MENMINFFLNRGSLESEKKPGQEVDLKNPIIKEGTVKCLIEQIDIIQDGLWDLEIRRPFGKQEPSC